MDTPSCRDCIFNRITESEQTDTCSKTGELCQNRRAYPSELGGCGKHGEDFLSRFVEKDYENWPLPAETWR